MVNKNSNHRISTGLYLRVKPLANGGLSKVFRQRICIGDERADLELGGYPTISPKDAMGMAAANKRKVEEGRDPRD